MPHLRADFYLLVGVGSAFPGEGAARAALLRHAEGRAFGVLAGADALVAALAGVDVWATHNLVDAAFGGAASSGRCEPPSGRAVALFAHMECCQSEHGCRLVV